MTPADTSSLQCALADRVRAVEGRVAAACGRAGRDRDSVTLVAVSKTRASSEILAAVEAGVRHLGENRPEEADEKISLVNDGARAAGLAAPAWHMIGHVQSRKAPLVVGRYTLVHSLDSLKLGRRLARLAAQEGAVLDCLVQVNVSGEDSKGGYLVPEPDRDLPAVFLDELDRLQALPDIRLRGLMTIPPVGDSAEEARPYFRRLRQLRDRLERLFPGGDWSELSMGMTDDFEVAIEEGATLVRVGRAIFGPRTA